MIWEMIWEILFYYFFKVSPGNISNFRHFIGILMISGSGGDFLSKKYLFRKKNKIIFFGSGKFQKHVKSLPQNKSLPRMFVSNLNIL